MRARKLKPGTKIAKLAVLAFGAYAQELHAYIARRIRTNDAAPDLTQEIFERFLQVKNEDAVRNPQAYLFGIASHVVRETRFREQRQLVAFDSDVIDEIDASLDYATPDFAEELILRQEVDRALARLPLIHQTILLLVKRDGFSYEEVAQKTDLTVATVTSYLFEARAKIKMMLKS